MTADVYYNENDPFAVEWLKQLIVAGAIEPGDVDDRDIKDVKPHEIAHYTQCHFFAGIGVWSYSLRLAGWPRERPVWTGSCPCQPFSAAGKGVGFDDKRHLWPYWHWLISQLEPDTILGEQVASKDGLLWFDLVQADLEGSGYASGGLNLCAAGVGAPHIRQRLWFVAKRMADAHDTRNGWQQGWSQSSKWGIESRCGNGGMEHADSTGTQCQPGNNSQTPKVPKEQRQSEHNTNVSERSGENHHGRGIVRSNGLSGENTYSRMADADDTRSQGRIIGWDGAGQCAPGSHGVVDRLADAGPVNGFWQHSDWLGCRDGKFRPVEPGTFPLVDGASARVGRLRGYGNAINAEAAKAFIEAVMEI